MTSNGGYYSHLLIPPNGGFTDAQRKAICRLHGPAITQVERNALARAIVSEGVLPVNFVQSIN